jgi:transcription initiation factor TFIIIB Brf1 subunit/transcription initiation factor TFIIB
MATALGAPRMFCESCGRALAELDGELCCPSCGGVYGPRLEALEAASSRFGEVAQRALGSYIGEPYMDLSRYPDARALLRLKALSDRQLRGRRYAHEHALRDCLIRACEALGIPRRVQEEAMRKGLRLLRLKLARELRASTPHIAAYSLLAALRGLGLTLISWHELREAFAALGHRLSTAALLRVREADKEGTLSLGVRDYIAQAPLRLIAEEGVASNLAALGLSGTAYMRELICEALRLLAELNPCGLQGRSPRAVAACLLYAAETNLALREGRRRVFTQAQVSRACGVAEYTVREVYSAQVRPLLSRGLGHADKVEPGGEQHAQGGALLRLHSIPPAHR